MISVASPSRSVGLPSLVEMPFEAAVFVAQTDMPPKQKKIMSYFSHGTTPNVVGAGVHTELFPASPSRSVGLLFLVEMPFEADVFVAQTDMPPKQKTS